MLLNVGFFHEKSKKKFEIFQNFPNPKFLEKIEFSKKNFKLQIALKNSLFELWPNKKICNEILSWRLHFQKIFGARALPRAARAESHIAVKTQKSWFFGIGGRIFWARARGSARAPKIFLESKSLWNFVSPTYFWYFYII